MPLSNIHNSTTVQQSYNRKGSKGFTLLELLFIVAIIGALAAIAIPAYNSYVDKARITVAYATLDTIRKSFESYRVEHYKYPPHPIVNGIDSEGRIAFSSLLLDQINQDITIDSYNSALDSYTLVANAKDSNLTQLTLTPTAITKAP